MRKIERTKYNKYLDSMEVQFAIKNLRDFYAKEDREQERYDFHLKKEIDDHLKQILEKEFEGKCGYCESRIESYSLAVVDRFRPYNGVRDGRTYYKDLYWWLTYDWDNLIYSCLECSQYKSNYFPVKGKRALSPEHLLVEEKKQLINPCIEDPFDHIKCDPKGIFIGLTEEGNQTIELLKLNRSSLIERRSYVIQELQKVLDSISQTVVNNRIGFVRSVYEKSAELEFINAQYCYLLHKMDIYPELREILVEEDDNYRAYTNDLAAYVEASENFSNEVESDFFPIEYIEIKNFKSIRELKIDFPKNDIEKHAWIALLGENGLGKSSILQAICIGLSPIYQTGNNQILEFIRKGAEEAIITIKERDSQNIIITTLSKEGLKISHKGTFKHPLIGYGSVRLIPQEKTSTKQKKKLKIRYKNLLDPADPINDIMSWLISIHNSQPSLFNTIAYSLKQLLPEKRNEKLAVKDGQLVFEGLDITFNSFSDGYRSTISLALDIMHTLIEGDTDMDKLSGIVVIDELGNQLHPRWQMQIVTQLRTVFPKINFIISTHHPLCLRGLKANEIIVLEKDEKDDPFILDNLPDPSHLRVDQILTSPIFGLHSAIDPEIEREFDEYYKLLAQDVLSESEKERLQILKIRIPKIKYLGDSLREELVIDVIDKLLAEKVKGRKDFNIDGLKKEARERVQAIWDKLKEEDRK